MLDDEKYDTIINVKLLCNVSNLKWIIKQVKWKAKNREDTFLGRNFNEGNLLFTRVKRTMTVCIFILQSTNKLHLG